MDIVLLIDGEKEQNYDVHVSQTKKKKCNEFV